MELTTILKFKRPTDLQAEWLEEVRTWLPAACVSHKDAAGDTMAFSVTVGDTAASTLYCCHLDTVHYNTGYQRLKLGPQPGSIQTLDGECLGADDGAGIWLLLEMIRASVPGAYLFHLGEETGCIGSRWMARHQSQWLKTFKQAISFDRPGTTDVITRFHGGRPCCSDAFALRLSSEISRRMNAYTLQPNARGGSTDVRHYMDLIGQCTNISIGYHRQHYQDEWLDVRYLMALKEAMVDLGHTPMLAYASAEIDFAA